MPLPKPLALSDLDDFRRAIGLRAVIVTDEDFALDDDVDLTDPEITISSIALELAKVEASKLVGEAQLRDWKAKVTNDILAKDPKLAEWKCRARLEAEPRWLEAKAHLAELEAVRLALLTFASAKTKS